ncbi:TIGR03759 family integrating conjugative element protein [Pseudomaricurvus alkylphenolicus]|uniref:TIGR03759 family integrating conjugative element protein n=1 Tax=Pseudomaricurvus alkylphenolicus TaxID=1306991 RepID=UPI0014214422|nr:TIGR03759 family integrating conjugative element protein [Pseudomaricurvus alkylphenolicus]NIB44037.1 TIGR03759 family integrating conjugative element protein [Pseudomaricurvus alkylphenolicus]
MSINRVSENNRWLAIGLCAVCLTVSAGLVSASRIDLPEKNEKKLIEHHSTELHDVQRQRIDMWGLGNIEWQRYRSLMQGIRGSVSPSTLSPIEVLGIHARTPTERRRYARMWAKMMREDAERILTFQLAYDTAQQELYPGTSLINADKLAQLKQTTTPKPQEEWQAEDRLLFFTQTDCSICDVLWDRLRSRLDSIRGIDVYFLDVAAGEEPRIRSWAADRQLDPAWLKERRVTLNIDGGLLKKLSDSLDFDPSERPRVLRRRDEQLSVVPAYRF